MREEVLLPGARRALGLASEADQARFEQIIRDLCVDPSEAEPIRTMVDVLPVELFRYNDGDYWIAYDLPDDATLRVWMIGRGPSEPRPH